MTTPKKTRPPQAEAPDFPAAPEDLFRQLDTEVRKLPPEKVEQARAELEKFLTGQATWLEMFDYPPEKLHQMAELGYNHFQVGRYDKAEVIFKGLTILDPENHYYHSILGATYQRMEKFAEAIVEYSVALEFQPKDPVSLTNRGEIYWKLKLLDLAAEDFKKAIALDPEEKDKWGNRSRMLLKKVEAARRA